MSNAGQKGKISPKMIEKLTKVIAAGNYVNVACQFCGISEATYYVWINRGLAEAERLEKLAQHGVDAIPDEREGIYLEFLEAVKRAETEGEVAAVAHVRTAMSTSWQAAMTYLERKHPDRWGRKDRNVNINVESTEKVDLSRLSDDELATLESIMMKAEASQDATRH
jgi:transposase